MNLLCFVIVTPKLYMNKIDKLIQMAKQNFDLAFVIAKKNNLDDELFNRLRCNYNLSYESLKYYMTCKVAYFIDYMDISYNLEEINLSGYKIKELDFSNNTNLKTINLTRVDVGEINISKNQKLEFFSIKKSLLEKIDFSNNTELEELIIGDVAIINEIDLSNNKKLTNLKCYNVCITEFDLSNNINLKVIHLPSHITKLIIKENNTIIYLEQYGCSWLRVEEIKHLNKYGKIIQK